MVIRTSTVAIFCFLLICQSIVECHGQRHFAKWNQFYTDNENEPALREPACSEEHTKNWFIYCQGTILEAVNAQRLFNDSKDFVDSPLRSSPEDVQAAFNAHFGNNSNNLWAIDRNLLKNFVDQHFDKPGSELVSCEPADWKAEPTRLMAIQDPELRQWALQLNGIWKKLCKKIRPEIADQPDRASLIYVPNEFIAPGGRFREFYYWDAYWIVRGLMASEMYGSAKKMIQNLAHMVNSFGFVPNGGRVYYLRRSQPPLLAPMLFEYYEHTGDREFLRQMLPVLETEVQFWDLWRRVDVPVENGTSKAYVFRADSSGPRPESFKEDMAQAQGLPDEQKAFFFKSVASAAESGWDFSSRWLRDSQHLASIETLNIVPVDLNAFMCWNFNILEDLYFEIRNYGKARHYRGRKFEMQDLLESVFYNETQGVWFDFNRRTGSQQWANFYPSVAMPLFTGCYDQIDQGRSQRLFSYMKENGVFSFPGGIPTSMLRGTGEQWDFPNGWSPLNHIVVEGLRKSQNAEMEEQAFQLAKKWVLANFKVFKETNHMWEKYVVTGEPVPGTGGEYEVQDGFGWTNGVVLDLLVAYRDRLFSPPPPVIVENGQRRNGAAFGLGQFYAIALLLYNSYCILFAINQ